VLGVYPHARDTGHVVLNEDGLVPNGTSTCHARRHSVPIEERAKRVARVIATAIATHRPHVVAIVRGPSCPDAIAERVVHEADASGALVEELDENLLAEILRADDASDYDQLGQVVTRSFFPELATGIGSWSRGDEDRRRRPRAIWKAAGGALLVLAGHRPEAVLALARGPLPPGLASFIERVTHRAV
jgi:hypothetical protein